MFIMINKQLLDFIEEQLPRVKDRGVISKELQSRGWTVKDIQEGFGTIDSQNRILSGGVVSPDLKQNSSGKKIALSLVLFLFIVGISCYFIWGN